MAERRRGAVAVLLATGALLATTVAPASADSTTMRDDRHDVVHIDQTDFTETPAPRVGFGDVTGARVTYGRQRISSVVRYRRLDRDGERHVSLSLILQHRRAGRLATTQVLVQASKGHWRGRVTQYGVWTVLNCRVRHRIAYQRDLFRVSFPARCLGSPRWVRPEVFAFSEVRGAPTFEMDDLPRQHGSTLRFGPRVHRG